MLYFSYQDVIKRCKKDREFIVLPHVVPQPNSSSVRFHENNSMNKCSSQSETSSFQSVPWRKRSSKLSKYSTTSDVGQSSKRNYSKEFNCMHGSEHSSDTTSMSADSLISGQSPAMYQTTVSHISV